MPDNIYCTYLTVYSGNKLPPFYIGSTSVAKIHKGYHGSVRSKQYNQIWKDELKNNPGLFRTFIITIHQIRNDAMLKEKYFHEQLNVVSSPLYINRGIATKKHTTLQGKDHPLYGKKLTNAQKKQLAIKMSGANNPFYGKKHSEEVKREWSKNKTGTKLSERTKKKLSLLNSGHNNAMYGKIHTEESRQKMRGRKLTTEQKEKLSAIRTGTHLSEETKAKLSLKMKGKILSQSHKDAISKSRSGAVAYNKGKKFNKITRKYE